jgi:hypothetical protein
MVSSIEERLEAAERRLKLLEALLDIAPDTFKRCQGNPRLCGESCTDKSCPLRNNQLYRVGSIMVTLLEEFRWHRAWADEMAHVRMVPTESLDRVKLRVQQSQLREALRDTEASLEDVEGVPPLKKQVLQRARDLRAEVERLDKEIQG